MASRTMVLVAVIPFRDEERHLPDLLASLAMQTATIDQLVLVDDGSTDASLRIATEFAHGHACTRVLRRPRRPTGRDRLGEAGELQAVQWAVDQLEEPWDVVGKLDADLRLSPDTIRAMRRAFDADPRLGITGAYLAELGADGRPVRTACGPEHVHGATKFYRRQCWEAIDPVPPILGWDIIDEARARMRGWRTRSLEVPGGDPLHLRPMGSENGLARAHRRWGAGAYAYGEHPLHVALFSIFGPRRQPILGNLNYAVGWAIAAVQRRPRAEPELRAYVRRDQLQRIRRRLVRGRRESGLRGGTASGRN